MPDNHSGTSTGRRETKIKEQRHQMVSDEPTSTKTNLLPLDACHQAVQRVRLGGSVRRVGMAGESKGVSGVIIPSKEDEDLQIEVNVLFFARARDLTGLTNMSLKVPNNSTANDCMSKLLATYPRLEEICDSMLLAINEEYADESTVLKDGDEFAIIPPLSGG